MDVGGVARVARAVAAAPSVALSGESNAMHAYRERLCLLSVNAGGLLFALDFVALRGRPHALRELAPLLEDPSRPIDVHGGEYLVAALKRDHQICLAGLRDGQQAAVLLDRSHTGYRALVKAEIGVTLPPPLSIDWSVRPLAPGAVEHALDDVRYLPALVASLLDALAAADLADEMGVACADVAWTPAEIGRFDPDGFHHLKGAHRLGLAALRVLRAIWLWRDAKARALDLPPGRVLSNELLLDYARHPDEALARLRQAHFHSRLVWGDHEELLQAVARARAELGPLPARREVAPPEPGERERGRRLKAWRSAEAARRAVGLQAVLPGRALRYLERHGWSDPCSVPSLGRRRLERYGSELRRLCGEPGAEASEATHR